VPPFSISRKETTMTIETLFGTEEITRKPRTIRFKQIKAVYGEFWVE
jgi:hypothetical protein